MTLAFSPQALAQPRFGQVMRRTRSEYGLSARAAARESGVPRATWDRVESGDDVLLSTVSLILIWMDKRSSMLAQDEQGLDPEPSTG